MNTITATDAKQNFGNCLMNVSGGPILIEKSGKPAAVLLSYNDYQHLLEIENKMLLAEAVNAVEAGGFLSDGESEAWFKAMNDKFTS